MYADQDPGRLLLLRVGHAHLQAEPRSQHRQDGARHDPGHQVVVRHSLLCHSHSRYIVGICLIKGNFSFMQENEGVPAAAQAGHADWGEHGKVIKYFLYKLTIFPCVQNIFSCQCAVRAGG